MLAKIHKLGILIKSPSDRILCDAPYRQLLPWTERGAQKRLSKSDPFFFSAQPTNSIGLPLPLVPRIADMTFI